MNLIDWFFINEIKQYLISYGCEESLFFDEKLIGLLKLEDDLYIDDLGIVELFDFVWEKFDLDQNDCILNDFERFSTLGDVLRYFTTPLMKKYVSFLRQKCNYLKAIAGDDADTDENMKNNNWFGKFPLLKPKKARQIKLRLFLFGHAGSTSSNFQQYVGDFPENIQCCIIEYPGHFSRLKESPIDNMTEMIDSLESQLLSYLKEMPFAFYGHSYGSLIAYELTRRLHEKHAMSPAVLFVSGRNSPNIQDPGPDEIRISELPMEKAFTALADRYDDPSIKKLISKPELLEIFGKGVIADLKCFENYQHLQHSSSSSSSSKIDSSSKTEEELLETMIIPMMGVNDPRVTENNMNLWKEMTSAFSPSVISFEGGHFFCIENPKPVIKRIRFILKSVIEYL